MDESFKIKNIIIDYHTDEFILKANEEICKYYKSLKAFGIEQNQRNNLISPEDVPLMWMNVNGSDKM